ncbi:MAG: anion permease [Anaerolineaceae bacterium]
MDPLMIVLLVLILGFDFLNGVHDSSNIVATVISSRALPPRLALTIISIAEFSGPLIFGVAVATTIGNGIVKPGTISMTALIAAALSAIIWGILTWILGLPSSASHAVIGGLIGAVVQSAGWGVLITSGILKIFIILFTSPVIGFIFGYIVMRIIIRICWNATPKVNDFFKKSQVVTSVVLALSYGANDAQKGMGIITLGLVTSGFLNKFEVPLWVILACASMIAIGTSVGGWNLIKTLGVKFYHIRPLDGFSTQVSSAIVILGAALFGGLVSTTQIVSASIMGVGSAERMNKVRWGVAKEIVIAWILTIPMTALLGGGISWVLKLIIR